MGYNSAARTRTPLNAMTYARSPTTRVPIVHGIPVQPRHTHASTDVVRTAPVQATLVQAHVGEVRAEGQPVAAIARRFSSTPCRPCTVTTSVVKATADTPLGVTIVTESFRSHTFARVREVMPDMPASIAGIMSGDSIVSVNGNKVRDMSQCVRQLREATGIVTIVLQRGGDLHRHHVVKKRKVGTAAAVAGCILLAILIL